MPRCEILQTRGGGQGSSPWLCELTWKTSLRDGICDLESSRILILNLIKTIYAGFKRRKECRWAYSQCWSRYPQISTSVNLQHRHSSLLRMAVQRDTQLIKGRELVHYGRRESAEWRSRRWWVATKEQCVLDPAGQLHIWTQSSWKNIQGLAPVHARTRCGHGAPALVKKLLALDSCWEGIAFSLEVWPLMGRPPSGEGHTSESI